MRTNQIIGLSEKAIAYLIEESQRDIITRTRNGEVIETKEVVSSEISERNAIEDNLGYGKIQFKKYLLKDGSWVFENIQEVIWSSGPMYFLALENIHKEWITKTFWTEEELKLYDY